jgi:hypothetical protein
MKSNGTAIASVLAIVLVILLCATWYAPIRERPDWPRDAPLISHRIGKPAAKNQNGGVDASIVGGPVPAS